MLLLLLHAIGRLGSWDEEKHVGALECGAHLVPRAVARGLPDLGAGYSRRPGWVAHDEALTAAGLGKVSGEAPSHAAGGAGDGDQGVFEH